MKKTLPWVLTALLLMPVGFQVASATSGGTPATTGSVSIQATCGLSIGHGAPLAFGSLANGDLANSTAGGGSHFLNFTNSGSVTAITTVAGSNWVSGGVTHIFGNHTKFSTTDQGPAKAYASKSALNSTNTDGSLSDGFVTFGSIVPGSFVNDTQWGLQASLRNLPFSGALTQTITFSATC